MGDAPKTESPVVQDNQAVPRFDFTPSPSDPYHLLRLLKDLRTCLKA